MVFSRYFVVAYLQTFLWLSIDDVSVCELNVLNEHKHKHRETDTDRGREIGAHERTRNELEDFKLLNE